MRLERLERTSPEQRSLARLLLAEEQGPSAAAGQPDPPQAAAALSLVLSVMVLPVVSLLVLPVRTPPAGLPQLDQRTAQQSLPVPACSAQAG
jgi:hypothetical protein